jgi:hypothetical protein
VSIPTRPRGMPGAPPCRSLAAVIAELLDERGRIRIDMIRCEDAVRSDAREHDRLLRQLGDLDVKLECLGASEKLDRPPVGRAA